jgi:hypothetical protein
MDVKIFLHEFQKMLRPSMLTYPNKRRIMIKAGQTTDREKGVRQMVWLSAMMVGNKVLNPIIQSRTPRIEKKRPTTHLFILDFRNYFSL